MKDTEPGHHDEILRKVLQEWRLDVPLPPRFQEQVWQRIGRNQGQPAPTLWPVFAHWICTVLSRPALVGSFVALFLVVGVTVGWVQGRQEKSRIKDELSRQYVRVLDPYQTPRQ